MAYTQPQSLKQNWKWNSTVLRKNTPKIGDQPFFKFKKKLLTSFVKLAAWHNLYLKVTKTNYTGDYKSTENLIIVYFRVNRWQHVTVCKCVQGISSLFCYVGSRSPVEKVHWISITNIRDYFHISCDLFNTDQAGMQ